MNSLEKEFLVSIRDCQKIIYKICHIYRDRKEEQEDMFQEIVFQLWKSYPSFNKLSKIRTWIYMVALNTAISSYRKPKPSIEYVENIPEYLPCLDEKNSKIGKPD